MIGPITLHYTEKLLRRATYLYFRERLGWWYVLLYMVGIIYLTHTLLSGSQSFFIIFTTIVALALALCIVASYTTQLQQSLNRFRRMEKGEATLELHDDYIRVSSSIGASDIPWHSIEKLWIFTDAWLFSLGDGGGLMNFPAADLPEDARAFIKAKVTIAH